MNGTKRIISLITAAAVMTVMILSVPVFAAAATVITTADQLLAVSADGDYVLGADIDLSGRAFTAAPIEAFSGTLDGDGYTVSGLDLAVTEGQARLGLISVLTGTVKNLTVSGAVTVTGEYARAGGIAATSTGTVENCRSDVDITVSVTDRAFIGGVVGYNRDNSKNGEIINCYNTGDITVQSDVSVGAYAGGITCAYGKINGAVNRGAITVNLPTAQIVYVAGVAAYEAEVINSLNEGDVTAVSGFQTYAGGMSAFFGSNSKIILHHNENRGAVSATMTAGDEELDADQARAMAGGIAAYMVNTAKPTGDVVSEPACTSVIRYCKNSGSVTSVSADGFTDYAGGIAGMVNGLVYSCVETADGISGTADGPIFGGFNPSGVLRGKVRDCTAYNSGKAHTPIIGTALAADAIALVDESAAQTAAGEIAVANGHAHKYRDVVAVPATCETDAQMQSYCAICDTENGGLTAAAGTALGHAWGDWTVTVPATEETEGVQTRVCGNDPSHVQTEVIPKLSHVHSLTPVSAVAATCETDGNIAYYVCSGCGLTFADSEGTEALTADAIVVKATGHAWGEASYVWADDNSTCTATRVCGNNDTHVETETVNAASAVTKNATCEGKGTTTYTADFENEAFATQTKDVDNIDPIGHSWTSVTYVWADDNSTCTATRSCARDAAHVETETATAAYNITTPASCEGKGVGTYTASFTNSAFAAQTKDVDIDATGHDWGDWIVTTPATESAEGVETRTCKNDPAHTETRPIPMLSHVHSGMTVTARPATCTEDGNIAYYVCSGCGLMFSDEACTVQINTEDVVVKATGHAWGEVTYVWADDNSACTATRVCGNDPSHVETETATATSEVTRFATCETAGITSYTAAFANSAFATQTKDVENIDALGHKYGEATYVWADDNSTCTATRVCGNDPAHIETETADVIPTVTPATCTEAGEIVYIATFRNDSFEIQTKEEVINALGHKYGEASYVWADDNSTCTATMVCANDDTHVITETATATSAITTPATCEGKGVTTYTATFTNSAFATQTKDVDIAALGHKYGEATYVWSEDNKTCTAEKICENDAAHKLTETAESKYEITKPATTEAEGEGTYTATFTNSEFATQTKTVKIDKLAPQITFVDVVKGAYYEEAVNWAVANGVTAGTSATTFSPNNKCTRGQVVTFLWRALGSPEPKTTVNPFTDVKTSGFYYKAVLWAVENDVTAGLSATTFGPNKECTRGQVVTFLWRAMGKPAPKTTTHPFTDVKSSGFYYTAMLWAVENNVTNGTTATTFGPNKTCTRGQVVTFLYRAVNVK